MRQMASTSRNRKKRPQYWNIWNTRKTYFEKKKTLQLIEQHFIQSTISWRHLPDRPNTALIRTPIRKPSKYKQQCIPINFYGLWRSRIRTINEFVDEQQAKLRPQISFLTGSYINETSNLVTLASTWIPIFLLLKPSATICQVICCLSSCGAKQAKLF